MAEKRFSYTARELAAAVSAGEVAATDICREFLDRADADQNNAFITVMNRAAMEAAERTDKRVAEGEHLPLAGVPVSIKDNICTSGTKTTCASAMLADFVPSYSASVYIKLLSAGAVPIGKTNMDEFAVGGEGVTSYFGMCRNPLDPCRTAGGSSSGSAASLGAGQALLSLGSDTGGSARLPAVNCGAVALKPTYGAVSRFGLVGMAPSLEQICPMALNTDDCELLFDVIRGTDPRDMTTSYYVRSEKAKASAAELRVGVAIPCDTAEYIGSAVLSAASLLEKKGARVDNVTLPCQDVAPRVYYTLSSAEASSNLARFDGIRYGHRSADGSVTASRSEGFGSKLKERIAEGVYSLTYDGGAPYVRALQYQREIVKSVDELFSEYDVIVFPVSDSAATLPGEGGYAGDRYNVYANLTGCPSLALPCGKSDLGLPVGVQLMAPHGCEDILFWTARIIEGKVTE